jgi:hypothetical protein
MSSRIHAFTPLTAIVAILCAVGINASAQSESVCEPAEAVIDGSSPLAECRSRSKRVLRPLSLPR